MLQRLVPVALLSLSFWLTGCAAYELHDGGYSNSRYSAFGYQQSAYPDVRERYYQQQNNYPSIRYQQHPSVQIERYRSQRQPVYYYRQVPAGYWPVPAWQGYQADEGHRHHRRHQHADERDHERDHERNHDRREYRREQRQHYEQYQRGGEQQRGWTLRIN